MSTCKICGEPMPPGEEMFNYHGYSGPCPKPPLPRESTELERLRDEVKRLTEDRDRVRDEIGEIGRMLSIYAEEPDENGQKSFNGCMIDASSLACVAVAYPLRELCRHQWDEQAGICRLCAMKIEDCPPATGSAPA